MSDKTEFVWVPRELLDRVSQSLGAFISDEGWKQSDMDTSDELCAHLLSAAPAPPAREDERAPWKYDPAIPLTPLQEALSDLYDAGHDEGYHSKYQGNKWAHVEAAYARAAQPRWQPQEPKRWRHKVRGTVYTELARGKFQLNNTMDMADCVIYRGEDGQVWARAESEFEDGRFESFPPAPVKDGGGE